MASTSKRKTPWPEFEELSADGRREIGNRNRRKIIEAMFELIREGNMRPSGIEVAERAEVGLRTVFRQFEDMDSIFVEMTEDLKRLMMPKILAPYEATNWIDRVWELVDRNADLFETIFPLQVALVVRRFESDVLMKQYKSEVDLLRASLTSILPPDIREDADLFAAIEVNLTFATWRRLREDQKLTVNRAKRALKLVLESLFEKAARTSSNR